MPSNIHRFSGHTAADPAYFGARNKRRRVGVGERNNTFTEHHREASLHRITSGTHERNSARNSEMLKEGGCKAQGRPGGGMSGLGCANRGTALVHRRKVERYTKAAPAYNPHQTEPSTPYRRTDANNRSSRRGLTAASTCSHGTRPSAASSSPLCSPFARTFPEKLRWVASDKARNRSGQDVCSQLFFVCCLAGLVRCYLH